MNVITSVRIIGNPNDISKFIYKNIQVDDPTEEDYKLWNCKKFLQENNHFEDNTSVPFTTAAILNVFNRYEEVMGEKNILDDKNTTTIVVSFESPYESMIPALKAMSMYFEDLLLIATKGDEHWEEFYGWTVISLGNILLDVSINFTSLITSYKNFIEKYPRIINNELTIIHTDNSIMTSIVETIRENKWFNVSNLRFSKNKICFDTFEISALEWYNSLYFPEEVHSCLFYHECNNKYFGYSCKYGNKSLANDFLSFKVKKFKFVQYYDISEYDYIQRLEHLGE